MKSTDELIRESEEAIDQFRILLHMITNKSNEIF